MLEMIQGRAVNPPFLYAIFYIKVLEEKQNSEIFQRNNATEVNQKGKENRLIRRAGKGENGCCGNGK